jgi:hypothetical protein
VFINKVLQDLIISREALCRILILSFLVWEEAKEPISLVFLFVVKVGGPKRFSVKGTKEVFVKEVAIL